MRHKRRRKQATNQPSNSANVLLVEDDPYARDVMSLLLTRDWRTAVVGEVGRVGEALRLLARSDGPVVDVVVVDGEHPSDPHWPLGLAEATADRSRTALLCTMTHITARQLERLLAAGFRGCVLKNEVGYCLADAVTLAHRGYWVMTPGVSQLGLQLPNRRAILSGSQRVLGLSTDERRVARLAILFDQSREDIAHDLGMSNASIRQVVSKVYAHIGVHALLDGGAVPEECFADPALVARISGHLRAISSQRRKQPRQKSTLAFHLLTASEVECQPQWE